MAVDKLDPYFVSPILINKDYLQQDSTLYNCTLIVNHWVKMRNFVKRWTVSRVISRITLRSRFEN